MIQRIVLATVLALAGTASAQTHTYLDPAMRGSATAPQLRKVLIIPPDVEVAEISAGGVIEKVAVWSKAARGHVTESVNRVAPQRSSAALAAMPEIASADQATLEQHLALFDTLAANVQTMGLRGGEAWAKRIATGDIDYSLGPGLAFLGEKTGADVALIIMVRDFVSSAERKAMMIAGALFGVVVPLGRTFAAAGLIDLKTGRLLWQSFDTSGTPDVRVAADANRVVDDLFKSFPALAAGAPKQ